MHIEWKRMLEILEIEFNRALESREYREFAEMIQNEVSDYDLAFALIEAAKKLNQNGVKFQKAFEKVITSEDNWFKACQKFDDVRGELLRLEKNGMPEDVEALLHFQENTLKLLCRIKGNRRFDEDSNVWAIVTLMQFLKTKPVELVEKTATSFLKEVATRAK